MKKREAVLKQNDIDQLLITHKKVEEDRKALETERERFQQNIVKL